MKTNNREVSVISITLCAIAITLVTTALVIATGNSATFRASMVKEQENNVVESSEYTKIYKLSEVQSLARQAYVDNYLSFYDKAVDLEGFKALVVGDLMQLVPENQLENYSITVTIDGVDVQYK